MIIIGYLILNVENSKNLNKSNWMRLKNTIPIYKTDKTKKEYIIIKEGKKLSIDLTSKYALESNESAYRVVKINNTEVLDTIKLEFDINWLPLSFAYYNTDNKNDKQ